MRLRKSLALLLIVFLPSFALANVDILQITKGDIAFEQADELKVGDKYKNQETEFNVKSEGKGYITGIGNTRVPKVVKKKIPKIINKIQKRVRVEEHSGRGRTGRHSVETTPTTLYQRKSINGKYEIPEGGEYKEVNGKKFYIFKTERDFEIENGNEKITVKLPFDCVVDFKEKSRLKEFTVENCSSRGSLPGDYDYVGTIKEYTYERSEKTASISKDSIKPESHVKEDGNKKTISSKSIKVDEPDRKAMEEGVAVVESKAGGSTTVADKSKTAIGTATNAMAMANIPQVAGNKLLSIGLGVGYSEKVAGFAIGVSGQDKRRNVIYKGTAAINTEKGYALGAGINYNFLPIKEPKIVLDNKSSKADNKVVYDLKEKAPMVKDNPELSELKDLVNNLIDQNNNNNKVINELKDELDKLQKGVKSYKVVIENFDLDKSYIKESQRENFKKAVKLANELGVKYIDVYGYTDRAHTEAYNLDLGMRRAKSAKAELLRLGLDKNIRVNLKSRAFNEITAKNPAGLRRVEIVINTNTVEIR